MCVLRRGLVVPGCLGFLGGERPGDVLQGLLFGPDAEEDLGRPAQRHDGRSDEEADGHQVGIATVDQVAEQEWAGDSAHGGSDGEETAGRTTAAGQAGWGPSW
ncbi:hypothetical protein [Streptomyces sp. I5]|uniref:hypothetical protein n=1 Tax=Streptomyces sp. I5 TaxID=2759947 RepID=UPI001E50F0D0|nr:hypothetical protein [Streptomyces sp. I5]